MKTVFDNLTADSLYYALTDGTLQDTPDDPYVLQDAFNALALKDYRLALKAFKSQDL
jgi:hypothetical protein